MKDDGFYITGSILQAYYICPRQAWLMSRQICGDQYDDFLVIGRLLSEETFKRDKKEVMIGNNKIDIVRKKNGEVILIESKKTSRALDSAELQLLFYMYFIKDKIENLRGEIHVPKEKKIVEVNLDEHNMVLVENYLNKAEKELAKEKPEKAEKIKYCRTCSYREFCWA